VGEKVDIENVNVPGQVTRVDAAKYTEMRRAMLHVLPTAPPGLSHAETVSAVTPELAPELFPAGKTAGWWSKTVQLDLEAKGVLVRVPGKPLRWYAVKRG